ncbi:MAG TPA: heme o synthase [Bryobacteraceae bacterium]|nr:heme o synthase [Bryobacteraceae bacterium]
MRRDSFEQKQQAAAWLDPIVEVDPGTRVFEEYLKLTKPRITLLILISTAVGYCFGAGSHLDTFTLLNALLGTTLLAAGAATLNQWYERDIDSKMNRTRTRPIPAGTIEARHALYFGVALSLLGAIDLWSFTNSLAAALGLLTSFAYLFAYTPLKRRTPLCTTIGAVPGAIPPLIGFAAASGHLNLDAWILFGILFLWQFPHFHAIAWMYREDYKRGDIKMLAVVEPDGKALSRQIIVTLLLLIPVTLAPAFVHMAGKVYFVAAFLLGLGLLYFGVQICMQRTYARARLLLLASVIYMPLLFAFLVFDNPKFTL